MLKKLHKTAKLRYSQKQKNCLSVCKGRNTVLVSFCSIHIFFHSEQLLCAELAASFQVSYRSVLDG